MADSQSENVNESTLFQKNIGQFSLRESTQTYMC